MRLAYFQTTGRSDLLYFVGLPSPPAADILTGFVLLSSGMWHRYPYPWFVVALISVLSFLMVSKLRVVKGAYFTPERIVRSWLGLGSAGSPYSASGSHIASVPWDRRKMNRPMRTMFTHTTTRVRAAQITHSSHFPVHRKRMPELSHSDKTLRAAS
jgi:phosphatidylserine synthase